ncbi:MAG TPA: DUF4215 domain-containing protein, partial [Polyangiaceae bacterium]|nr:DUF4215 domain-containing protein [Polyangiaceae bacterium]
MNRSHLSHFGFCVSVLLSLNGCGGDSGKTASGSTLPVRHQNNGGSSGAGSVMSAGGGGGEDTVFLPSGGSPQAPDCDPTKGLCVDAGEPGFCSDGNQDPGEGCDDGNAVSGDGCTDACQLEANFVCPTPGHECVSTVKCGDKKITGAETCDDGNKTAGDGCDDTCKPEPGWSCPIQGQPCVAAACGDGIIAGAEQCEDGDAVPVGGDGCDVNCQIEVGGPDANGIWQSWVCPTAGMPCAMTVCNDGVKEGSEPCDDGNQVVGDGCNPLCQVEPSCPPEGGACSSRCGDGLILPTDNEACDDGNTLDGDGCSSTCTIEAGFMC